MPQHLLSFRPPLKSPDTRAAQLNAHHQRRRVPSSAVWAEKAVAGPSATNRETAQAPWRSGRNRVVR